MKSSSGKRRKNNLVKLGLLAAGVGLAAGMWGLSPPDEILPPPMAENQSHFSDPAFRPGDRSVPEPGGSSVRNELSETAPMGGTPSLVEKGGNGRVDLNAATPADLMTLPGIGEKTAKQIIEYRIKHGNYSSLESVMEVHGIGPEKFKKILPYITVK